MTAALFSIPDAGFWSMTGAWLLVSGGVLGWITARARRAGEWL